MPTIFAWTQKNSESNVIKIPTYVPKNSENSDSDNETGNEINDNVKMDSDAEKLEVKIEDTDIFEEDLKIDEAPKKNAKEENFSLEEYKTMYQRLLSENNYLKNELENLTYKYKDQGELYDNLVVVNKTTQKENNEFRHTIAILQACLKNTQKQYYLQKTLMNEPNLFLIAKTIQENTLKF